MDELNRAVLYLKNVLDSGVFNTSLCDEDVCWGSVQSVNDAINIIEKTKTKIKKLEDENEHLRRLMFKSGANLLIDSNQHLSFGDCRAILEGQLKALENKDEK